MVTVTSPTNTNGSGDFNIPVDLLEETITVNSDTMVEVMVIDNRNYQKSIFHILNTHATAGLTYNIYGSNNYNSGTYPTFNATTTWKKLLSSDKALTALTNDAETLTDNWTWIALVMKRTDAGVNSSSIVRIRAQK